MSIENSAVGAILEIPASALEDIKKAEAAIKSLQAVSKRAASAIKGHFDNTMVSGVNTFIRKVEEASGKLGGMGGIQMPGFDASGLADSVRQVANAAGQIDKSALTGANRMKKIADAITTLSQTQPAANAFQGIADGLNTIANVSAATITKITELSKTMSQLARDYRTVQTAMKNDQTGYASVSQYNKLYKEQADLVRKMNAIKENGGASTQRENQLLQDMAARYAEINKQLDRINAKKQTAASVLARTRGSDNLMDATDRSTSYGAIGFASQAKSLKELQDAYKNLKAVMATVNPDSESWRRMNATLTETRTKIDDIRKKMGEFKNQASAVGISMGQLGGVMASVFSIQAITGYIHKMVEVRAQMELQNVALRAIIQNKDEADRIFMQVQRMAMESPFNIMQLTTYTKQLAAYNIEASKLVDTTKMLADVSAGLGVDFGRLSLAFGQVKSANYLRATELRQFTEAGLNMGAELAKYYTELEGRVVSVGEVMDKISRRMVRFEDVEEIFRRMTSAGGMFYDMQRKQSDSVYGQIQRITDAMTIMMNEIGKSNDGSIKTALTAIRSLLQHWRLLVPIIKTVGALMGTVLAVKGFMSAVKYANLLGKAILNIGTALKTAKTAMTAMNLAMSSTGIGLLITAAATLTSLFIGLREEANALRDEIDNIGAEAVADTKEAVSGFLSLAKTATDATKTYAEQQEAIESLNRGYGEYIDTQKLTSEYLKSLKGDYTELTDAIRDHYAEIEHQKKMEAIFNSDSYADAQKEMRKVGELMFNRSAFDDSVTKAEVTQFMDNLTRAIAEGKVENTAQAMRDYIKKAFGESVRDIDYYTKETYNASDFTDVVDKLKPLQADIDAIGSSILDARNHQEALNNSLQSMSLGNAIKEAERLKFSMTLEQGSIDRLKSYADTMNLIGNPNIDAQITAHEANIARLQKRYEDISDVIANRLAGEAMKQIESGLLEFDVMVDGNAEKMTLNNEILRKNVERYFTLSNQIRKTKTVGESYEGQIGDLTKEQDECWKSINLMGNALGVDFVRDELDAMRTTYDFETQVKQMSTKALPAFMAAAIKTFSDPQLAILKLESHFGHFAQKVNNLFGVELFKGVDAWVADVDKRHGEILAKMQENADIAANTTQESLASYNDKIQKDIAKSVGVDASIFNKYIKSATESNSSYAETLRKGAKDFTEKAKAYQQAIKNGTVETFLKNEGITEGEAKVLNKNAEALERYANARYPKVESSRSRSGGKGNDPWAQRISLFKELNNEYEKLLQNYSKEEALLKIRESYKDAVGTIYAGQGGFSDIANWVNFDKESMIKIGREMLDSLSISPEKRKELEKQIAHLQATVDVQLQKDAVDAMKKDMEAVGDNFELSETFRKLGVSTDLVFMLGGKPTTLEEYKRHLIDTYEEAVKNEEKYGKEGVKAYEELLKKITDLEQRNAIERAKNYVKYLTESLGERAQIEVKAMQEIQKIREDQTLDDFSKEQAIMQKRKKMHEDLNKVDLDNLKSSDVYISVFKDLENASREQLQYVINKLRELQSTFKDLSPAQVKSIANDLKKLENAMAEHDSFKTIGSDIQAIIDFQRNRNQLLQQQVSLQQQLATAQQNVTDTEVQLADARIKLNGIPDKSSEEYKKQEAIVRRLEMLLRMYQSDVAKVENDLGNVTDEIQEGTAASERLRKTWEKINKVLDMATGLISDLTEGLDNMGLMTDSLRDGFESTTSILSNVGQIGSGAVQAFTDPNPINKVTGAVQALGGAIKLVGNIFAIGDKKKERQIKKLQEKVEDLGKAYEKLHDKIEEAYTFDDYNAGYESSIKNLKAQQDAYREMLRLEESKKKTDQEKIKQYTDALDELAEKEKQLREDRYESFGSISEKGFQSEAENFVSAWLDAYKETGDGLDALGEHWDEFFENLVLKQAASAVVAKRMDKYIKQINAAIDSNDTGLSLSQTFAQIGANLKNELGQWNEDLKAFFDAVGIKGGTGDLVLSDLQKGIQNITEPQAAAIEAYLNSMRFAVYRQVEQLDGLIAAINAQYSASENPVVTELKGIRSVLDSIDSRLASVITRKTGAGAALKIY